MDRAAFLRSLNFLRPLPPSAWDSNSNNNNDANGENEPYSGSTITPPTPSKNHSLMLFEGNPNSLYVVSIEPTDTNTKSRLGKRINDVNVNGVDDNNNNGRHQLQLMGSSRKRGRGDDLPAKVEGSMGPLFFENHSDFDDANILSGTNDRGNDDKTATADDDDADDDDESKEEDDGMDVDQRQEHKDKDNGAAAAASDDLKFQINSDPSLCTFEAAIVKKLPSTASAGGNAERENNYALTTPTKHRRDTSHDNMDEAESKALIFRFGGHFVFQVDESAIVELKYEPGHDDEGGYGYGVEQQQKSPMTNNGSRTTPPSKRQRNGGGGSSKNDTGGAYEKAKSLPPSLIISFGTCTFRVFSLDDTTNSNLRSTTTAADDDESRPSSRIWGALAKPVESAESRISKARSVLMQQFEIGTKEMNHRYHRRVYIAVASSSWKMAPPGSGLAFESWPDPLDGSSFHHYLNTLQNEAERFLQEKWSHCLQKKKKIIEEFPSKTSAPSPQKSSSPSKSGSSSTHFEQGQNEHTPTKNGTSQPHSAENENENDDAGKIDNDGKNTESNSSELTHETHQNEKENCAEALILEESERKGMDIDKKTKKDEKEDKEQPCNSDSDESGEHEKESGEHEKKAAKDEISTNDEKPEPKSWKDEIFNNYHQFQKSALYMEKAMVPATAITQQNQNGASTSQHPLTSCAESLSSSYLTGKEFMTSSQLCEEEVDNSTSEMEGILEKMFPARPARGRKLNVVTCDQSEDYERRIEELMKSRKEAVAAKFALLMTPKR